MRFDVMPLKIGTIKSTLTYIRIVDGSVANAADDDAIAIDVDVNVVVGDAARDRCCFYFLRC